MWSEHCSYKSSRALPAASCRRTGPQVLQGPGENAGAVDIGDGLAAVFKIESHNHPSFVEPFQGAATGVGGILRDVFTMGARPVAIMDSLRFGSLDHPRTPFLVRGVVAGIGALRQLHRRRRPSAATRSSTPRYDHNILVNAFTLGIAPRRPHLPRDGGRAGQPGHLRRLAHRPRRHPRRQPAGVGGARRARRGEAAGRAGGRSVHGEAPARGVPRAHADRPRRRDPGHGRGRPHVAARSRWRAAAGSGIVIDLDEVPLREEGMTPYEILLSESQERMLLVAQAGQRGRRAARIFARWDLQAVVIGRLTDDGVCARAGTARRCARSRAAILTDVGAGLPAAGRGAGAARRAAARSICDRSASRATTTQTLQTLLESPNLCSREWIYRQYDQFVGGSTVVRPGGDAAVVRVEGTRRGLALAVDCNSRYTRLDPYLGAVIAVVEAARNCVAVGAQAARASRDCLNFGNPERPEVMWEFQQAIAGIRDACLALGTPVVSGNVSFYNETEGRNIPPTPTIAMVGLLDDVELYLTPWWKAEGDVDRAPRPHARGARRQRVPGRDPRPDARARRRGSTSRPRSGSIAWCSAAAHERLLRSAHDVAEGGLAVALAECSFGGRGLGARVALERRHAHRRAALRREPVAHARVGAAAQACASCATWRGARTCRARCWARCAGTAIVIEGLDRPADRSRRASAGGARSSGAWVAETASGALAVRLRGRHGGQVPRGVRRRRRVRAPRGVDARLPEPLRAPAPRAGVARASSRRTARR